MSREGPGGNPEAEAWWWEGRHLALGEVGDEGGVCPKGNRSQEGRFPWALSCLSPGWGVGFMGPLSGQCRWHALVGCVPWALVWKSLEGSEVGGVCCG